MVKRGSYVREHGNDWEGTFTLLRETPMAMRLWDGTGTTDNAKWVPKSQIKNVVKTEKRDVIRVTMSEWIAKEKRFI